MVVGRDILEERESIWAVPRSALVLYRIVFSVLVISSVSIVAWYEIHIRTNDGPIETFMAIGRGSSPFIILSAGLTVVFVEGLYMLAEILIKERYLRKGHEAGLEEGRKTGLEEGRKTEREERAKREREAYQRFGVVVDGVRMLPDTDEVRRFLAGESEE